MSNRVRKAKMIKNTGILIYIISLSVFIFGGMALIQSKIIK